MIEGNNHTFQGVVISKHGPYTVPNKAGEDTGFRKFYLIVKGDYIEFRGKDKGKAIPQYLKISDTLWETNLGYNLFKDIFPGDEVRFVFSVRGKYIPESKGRFGEPVCWNDLVVSSKIEVLNTQNRTLYDNEPKEDDGLASEPPTPRFKYEDGFVAKDDDDGTNDLPFSWLIPLMLPLAANLII